MQQAKVIKREETIIFLMHIWCHFVVNEKQKTVHFWFEKKTNKSKIKKSF